MSPKNRNPSKTVRVNGEFLAKRRKAKGLSQVELAEMANVSENSLGKMERSESVLPSLVRLVADALDIKNVEELTTFAPPSPTKSPSAKKVQSISAVLYDDGRITITTEIDVAPDQSDINGQAKKLFASLASFLALQDGYKPDELIATKGSLKIAARLTRRDAAALTDAFIRGELAQFHLVSVTASTSWPPLARPEQDQDTPVSIYKQRLKRLFNRWISGLTHRQVPKLPSVESITVTFASKASRQVFRIALNEDDVPVSKKGHD
jgi:transcriptional regulator with XRE-family HTH domain